MKGLPKQCIDEYEEEHKDDSSENSNEEGVEKS